MANQLDPNNYSLMCRCPLKDAAAAKAMANENGMTLSGFVATLIHEKVQGVALSEFDEKWMAKKFRMNKRARARADRKAASATKAKRQRLFS